VDLNLDSFSLEEPVSVAAQAAKNSWAAEKATGAAVASAFWANLDGQDGSSAFDAEDLRLLKSVFNPHLSDRREEGDRFTPPDPNPEYVGQLRSLVKQEEAIRQQRAEHFLSAEFRAEEPGPLFPHTWAPTHGLARAPASGMNSQPRPDLLAQADMFDLKSTTPEFDRVTEDGFRYRVYKFGSIEVRTTQEGNSEPVIGAIFSTRSPAQTRAADTQVQEQEKIAKVTEYVEADTAHYRSYVVLETEQDHVIVTEKLADGTLTWEENPEALEDRNAFAKFIRSWDCTQCKKSNLTVADMEAFKTRCAGEDGASHSARKQYAQGTYNAARGVADRVDSGFAGNQFWNKGSKANQAKKETKKSEKMMARRGAQAKAA
jgi:hypothetical protein